jgi:preprotein translocase subunit YajC
MWLESEAWAAGAASQPQGMQQMIVTTVLPLALLFLIFYFMLIRPQTKRAGDHDKMIKALKRNDEVVTNGGLIGRIVEISDKLLTLEIAPNVRVRVERAQVASLSAYAKTAVGKKE